MSTNDGHPDHHYEAARAALRQTQASFQRLRPEERAQLEAELKQIESMTEKLERGRVDIVVFGEISTGKSALINALAGAPVAEVGVQGGVTREAGRTAWRTASYALPGYADSHVELIDTPGLNEVEGAERARLAREEAMRADLVLFVTDSDLNELERATLAELAEVNKAIVLVLNKADLYTTEQRERLLAVLRDRVAGLVAPEDVVPASADPMPREYVIESPDGSTRTEERKPPPDIEQVKLRLIDTLHREGKALVALNGSLFAADVSDRVRAVKVRLRDEEAQRLIMRFAAVKGAAVALNPVPVADVAGGFGTDAAMIVALGQIYGERISFRQAGGLAVQVAKSVGWVALAEGLTHAASHLVKAATVGAGVVLTALPQGLAAAYGSYIVGQGAKFYFEHHCGWAGQSPKKVVRDILRRTDNRSVLRQLWGQLLERLSLRRPTPAADAAADAAAAEIDSITRRE